VFGLVPVHIAALFSPYRLTPHCHPPSSTLNSTWTVLVIKKASVLKQQAMAQNSSEMRMAGTSARFTSQITVPTVQVRLHSVLLHEATAN
jgi:hypothetical protein